jgi:long-subunit acyl-CoA synthetase (AMP-forming)
MVADGLVGDRGAIYLPNRIEAVLCFAACFSSGAVAAPLNTRYAPPELERALMRAVSSLPIGVGWGMTEAIWPTVAREAHLEREGCIGRPVGGAEVRVDPWPGELLVRGPMVMSGYWEDPALTAATLDAAGCAPATSAGRTSPVTGGSPAGLSLNPPGLGLMVWWKAWACHGVGVSGPKRNSPPGSPMIGG